MLADARRLIDSNPDRAAALARQLLAAQPGNIEAALVLGAALRRIGQAAAAHGVLAPLAIRSPAAWGVQYELGMACAALGNDAAAADALDRATRLNPQ